MPNIRLDLVYEKVRVSMSKLALRKTASVKEKSALNPPQVSFLYAQKSPVLKRTCTKTPVFNLYIHKKTF